MVFMYFPAGLAGSRYCYMYSSYRRPPRRLVRRGGRVFNRPAGITPGKHSTFILRYGLPHRPATAHLLCLLKAPYNGYISR